ncbi:hypothetical protein QBC47DRAFT_415424 [Echria macrotheca]|uniref:MACPF domain-containing protein n=1 Tax=Echria macrotheca TaxID=438768 RepID=A0AAJ0F4Q2_9PEZI|nr:hypothetical protein QBC47DRAFT_415424 [Echria macrotheca]
MGLVDDFPADPFTPSLRYAATCQLPLSLPWGCVPVDLGTPLLVSRQKDVESRLDKERNAFSSESLRSSRLVFTSGAMGEVSGADTSGASSSSSHMDFSIAAQVGGSLLGAEGRVKYEESASSNSSNVQSSFRSTYRSGTVRFLQDPELSTQALSILRSKNRATAEQAFKDAYGEYYVAAYILGGSNATMLAGATAAESYSQSIHAEITIKILFARIDASFDKYEQSGYSSAVGSLAGYDTLERVALDLGDGKAEPASFSEIIEKATANRARGDTLVNRAEAKMREAGLDHDAIVSWQKCEEICRAGLVVELLLLPYSGLRQYIEALHTRV